MELTFALDPAPMPVNAPDSKSVDAHTPGTEADDPASQAFASLLAGMLAAPPPPPAPPMPDQEATDLTAKVALPAPADPAPGLPAALLPVAALPTMTLPIAIAPLVPAAVPAEADAVAADVPDATILAAVVSVVPGTTERAAPAAPAPAFAVPSTDAVPVMPVVRASDLTGEGDAGNRREAPTASPVSSPAPSASTAQFPPILRAEAITAPAPALAAPNTPAAQVVRAVTPLRHLGEGNHNVVLELHPVELGAVRVELTLNAGIVHLGLQAEKAATGQLLRNALPELRSQLDAAGLVAGHLAVDSGQSGPGDRQVPWRTGNDAGSGRTSGGEPQGTDTPTPTPTSVAPGRVDLRL